MYTCISVWWKKVFSQLFECHTIEMVVLTGVYNYQLQRFLVFSLQFSFLFQRQNFTSGSDYSNLPQTRANSSNSNNNNNNYNNSRSSPCMPLDTSQLFSIASLQSSTRPGCVLELDAITDASQVCFSIYH